eukprot:Em0013g519a
MDCSFLCTAWAKAVIVLVLIAASSQGAFVSRKAPKAIISSYDEVYPVVVGSSDDKPHPSQLTVEIKTRGAENFTLVLSLNRACSLQRLSLFTTTKWTRGHFRGTAWTAPCPSPPRGASAQYLQALAVVSYGGAGQVRQLEAVGHILQLGACLPVV